MQELVQAIGKWSLRDEVMVRFVAADGRTFVLVGLREQGRVGWYFGREGQRPLHFAADQLDFAFRQARIAASVVREELERLAAATLAEWTVAQAQARASFPRAIRRRAKALALAAFATTTSLEPETEERTVKSRNFVV